MIGEDAGLEIVRHRQREGDQHHGQQKPDQVVERKFKESPLACRHCATRNAMMKVARAGTPESNWRAARAFQGWLLHRFDR